MWEVTGKGSTRESVYLGSDERVGEVVGWLLDGGRRWPLGLLIGPRPKATVRGSEKDRPAQAHLHCRLKKHKKW